MSGRISSRVGDCRVGVQFGFWRKEISDRTLVLSKQSLRNTETLLHNWSCLFCPCLFVLGVAVECLLCWSVQPLAECKRELGSRFAKSMNLTVESLISGVVREPMDVSVAVFPPFSQRCPQCAKKRDLPLGTSLGSSVSFGGATAFFLSCSPPFWGESEEEEMPRQGPKQTRGKRWGC